VANAEHKPIMGVSWQNPECGPGGEPLVRGIGAKPLKLKVSKHLHT